jgi:polyferredoxin/Pyruvate/2-oxoacid:ferredoxin oxidoreductase delta subunit
MRRLTNAATLQNARRLTQALFLLLFLFLFIQTESKGSDDLGYPIRLFLDFDPLILVTTLLSAHAAAPAFALSILTIVITILFGRVFCGWVCPMGTLNNLAGSLRSSRPSPVSLRWYRIKYYILVATLASALFSLQPVGIMDPLSLLIRSLSVSIYPLFNYGVRSVFDAVFQANPFGIAAVTEPVYTALKKTVLSFDQSVYRQGVFIGLLFCAVLSLNLIEKRFWCKYLCPLGAFLGILSRGSPFKRAVSEGCTSCGACTSVCQGNASPELKEQWRDTECLVCRNCDDVCPQNAVRFGFGRKRPAAAMDLGRRQVILSALSGIAVVPMLRTVPVTKPGAQDPVLLRPPGSLPESDFLKRCVKCGECMKVCITNGLQPAFLEAGLEGIWSPVLVPRIGYCEYRCTLCGQVCPTGAIERLHLEKKARIRIGLAMIDKGRCLPWTHSRPCIVCEEVCPTPKKAIWLEEARVRDRQGKIVTVKQPHVDLELCIGCGICEAKCPVAGKPAIYVTNTGESRSEDNQLLLSPSNEEGQ